MEISDQPAGPGGGGTDKLRLKVSEGNAQGMFLEVEKELVLGRQSEGPGSLGNDIELSRRHAKISHDLDGRYMVEDLGSTNGTYVNGRAVDGPVSLEPGDRIEVGASVLIVQVSSLPHTPTSTPVTTTTPSTELEAVEEAPGLAAPAAPAPAAPAPAAPPPELPSLGLRIDFDLGAQAVTIRLEEGGGEVTLVHEDGRWRLAEGAGG